MDKPVILVDGSSYFFRAFHALPPLSNSKGMPTGAVYGVINMLRRLIKDYQPTHVAVIFDAAGKTFRDDLYPLYKANRPPTPDELSIQFDPLLKVIEAMGIPLLLIEGVEADDVIATLCAQARHKHQRVIVSTGDKDMAQLVNDQVTLINTMTNTVMDRAGVQQKFLVCPEQIIDYLTLIGDKVDNIPGVDKVGPKTAVKWLQQYGTLESVIEHADEIKGKVGENLLASLKQLPLSKQLIILKKDVPLKYGLEDLKCQPVDEDQLIALFKQLEFRNWLNDLLEAKQASGTLKQTTQYHTILKQQDLDRWLQQLKGAKQIAFDSETTDLDPLNAQIVGVSFAIKDEEAIYIPCGHDYVDAPKQLNRDDLLQQIKPILEDTQIEKVGQNLKYDIGVLANYDIEIRGIMYDTMLESYVLNAQASRHDMDSLALKYLGKKTTHFEDIAGKGAKQLSFNEIDLKIAGPYAAEDADIALQLHHNLWPKVVETGCAQHVFRDIEMPLVPVLSRMERHGVLIDQQLLQQQSIVLSERIEILTQKAYQLAGEHFNLASPKQLQQIFFDKLKLPVLQKTAKGQASTAEAVLQELAYDYPLPKIILEYRSLSKLKSTYLDALPKRIHPKTNRVHTSYNQAVTATGRLSSTNPNLQNIPVRKPEGREIRRAFIAPAGYQIIAADYSQIELRIIAHLSQDKGLLHAFDQGWDIHHATAAEVFDVPLDAVTPEQRRRSKAINFGLIYGMSAYGLAKQLGLSREQAQEYIDRYFQRYPGILAYMNETRKKAHETGFVETLFGRRLYLPEINARNLQRQRAAERTAINAPMQGTGADLIKMAMIEIDQWLQQSNIDAYMIMQVHDELVFEVAESCTDAALEKIKKIMTGVIDSKIQLEVAVGVGANWEEAH